MWSTIQGWFQGIVQWLSHGLAGNPVLVGVLVVIGVWLLVAAFLGYNIVRRRRLALANAKSPVADRAGTVEAAPLPDNVPERSSSAPQGAITKDHPNPIAALATNSATSSGSSGSSGKTAATGPSVRFRQFSDIIPPSVTELEFPDREVLVPKRRPLLRTAVAKAQVSAVVKPVEEPPTMRVAPASQEAVATSEPGELASGTQVSATVEYEPMDSKPNTPDVATTTSVEPTTQVERTGPVEATSEAQSGSSRNAKADGGGSSISRAGRKDKVPRGLSGSIGRPGDGAAHDRNYSRFRSSFELFVRGQVHQDIRPNRCIVIGLTGHPVLSTYPSVFWRNPDAFFDEDLHARTDALLTELHRYAVRSAVFRPAVSLRDREVAIALFHHALWRGRLDLLASLVFRMEEIGELLPEVREVAVVIFEIAGETQLSHAIDRDSHGLPPYLSACLLFLRARRPAEASLNRTVRRSESLRETRLIAWLRGAAAADQALETRAIEGLLRESANQSELVELVAALLGRGQLYRAVRLLYRLQRSDHAFGRAILEIYFRNGKYHCYLRALQVVGPARGPRTYYETAFCLALSELKVEPHMAISAFQRQGLIPELPSDQERTRFERNLAAVSEGRYRPTGIPQRFSELVALLYFYAEGARSLQTSENQKSYVRTIVRAFRNNLNAPEDLFRHELVLPYLIWGFVYGGKSSVPRTFMPFLESLAGRSQAVRVLLGVIREADGDRQAAIDYLSKAPQHPYVLHRLTQLTHECGDLDAAVRLSARLVRLYPGEAVFRHNQGALLELAGQRYGAEQAYGRAVDLQSDLAESRERLSRLLALRTTGPR